MGERRTGMQLRAAIGRRLRIDPTVRVANGRGLGIGTARDDDDLGRRLGLWPGFRLFFTVVCCIWTFLLSQLMIFSFNRSLVTCSNRPPFSI